MNVRASTRLFVLLGDPVAHSRSPIIQNAAFQACGIDAVYVALPVTTQHVATLMRAIAGSGGGGNITIPHKQAAARAIDRCSAVVTATQACNTFWFEDGLLTGDNTDVEGFRTAASGLLGSLEGIRALVLGAGGAASAAVHALLEANADRVDINSRRAAAAERLAARIPAAHGRVDVICEPGRLRGEAYDLVINATPLGLREADPLPVSLDMLGPVTAVLDMVYGGSATPLVRAARQLGIAAIDGAEMLIAQGAASFERWFGRPAPANVMREAFSMSARD